MVTPIIPPIKPNNTPPIMARIMERMMTISTDRCVDVAFVIMAFLNSEFTMIDRLMLLDLLKVRR
jgi:hypothetical protein